MTHSIIIGQTLSGKTTLAKRLAAWYLANGIGVVVLDPMNDPGWNPDGAENFILFTNAEEFLDFVKDPDRCLQAAIFVDESGMILDKYAEKFNWLTCQGRHHGHVVHLLAQRAEMISKTLRSQCSTVFAFNINPDDAKAYARDFNAPAIMDAPNLPQGQYIKVSRFSPVKRGRLW